MAKDDKCACENCDFPAVGTINDIDVCLSHGGRIMNKLRSGESFETYDKQMYRRY